MTRLQIEAATVTLGQKTRLGPVTLDLELAGITAVLGPNGAGKSLFLALCHGTLPPDGGTVMWHGQSAGHTRKERGVMLQTTVVLRRTVAANLAFALHSAGVPKAAQAGKIAAALETARLSGRANAPAATLSGGELRRMNLARALVTEPKVLLLDEPFAGLDPGSAAAIEGIITETAQHTPILMCNHDLGQSRRIAEQVLFFSEGALVENALASEFFSRPKRPQSEKFLQGQLL